MADLPTIKIAADTESGWMLINESDFNAEEHDLFEPDPPAPGAMAGGADLEDMTLTQLRKLASDSQGEAAPTRHSRPLASDPRRTTGSAAN